MLIRFSFFLLGSPGDRDTGQAFLDGSSPRSRLFQVSQPAPPPPPRTPRRERSRPRLSQVSQPAPPPPPGTPRRENPQPSSLPVSPAQSVIEGEHEDQEAEVEEEEVG